MDRVRLRTVPKQYDPLTLQEKEKHLKFHPDELGGYVILSVADLCGILKTLKDLTYNPKTDIFENIDPRVLNLADELGVQ